MKKSVLFLFITSIILFNSCGNEQTSSTNTQLTAIDFSKKMESLPEATVIDVRTPQEFESGHLENAVNYDWTGTSFQEQTSKLDISSPIFVYCLSGGRSRAAANQMRADGFKEVYELDGGMMKWRAAGLSEITAIGEKAQGMDSDQFKKSINSDKIVLVDFYADWCAPCKRMEPYLKEIADEMANKVVVIRINADENQALCEELKIYSLPTLHVYKDNNLSWKNVGYVGKEEVLGKLK